MDQSTQQSANQTSPKTPPPASPPPTTSGAAGEGRLYVRSYTCTFCEKGFSNAQALGGHMNIHRRDRARLRNVADDSEIGTSTTMIDLQRSHQEVRREEGGPAGDGVDLELRLGMKAP